MKTKVVSSIMDELLKSAAEAVIPTPGSLIEGTVVAILKNKVLVDLGGGYTGVISGHEAHDSFNTLKQLQEGDSVSSYILEEENEDGLVVLSLRKASQKKTWNKFVTAFESGETITVISTEANKGGLLLNVDGIKGFIQV